MKAIESTEHAAEVAKMYLEKRGYSEVKAVGGSGKAASLVATDPKTRALAFVKVVLERDAASGFTPHRHVSPCPIRSGGHRDRIPLLDGERAGRAGAVRRPLPDCGGKRPGFHQAPHQRS